MNILGGAVSVSGISFLVFSVFVIVALGYALGRISIKGIRLGTSGVFAVALLYGAFFGDTLQESLMAASAGGTVDIGTDCLKMIENIGLIFFVASVGFIAGPNFFKNLKKNFKSYVMLGIFLPLAGSLVCLACYYLGNGMAQDSKEFVSLLVGIMAGAMTSTPAFSAAKSSVAPEYEPAVVVGYGIAYLFGVLGIVLFVQLVPRIVKADFKKERELIRIKDGQEEAEVTSGKKVLHMDPKGFFAFGLVAALGVLVGGIRIPLTSEGFAGTSFSLTTTGGVLLMSLLAGHFGKIGPVSLRLEKNTLELLRELGLMLFLVGTGVAGGSRFVEYFKPVYFLYGVLITIIPLIIGFLFARFVLKLPLFNSLGAVCGGRTSTPALGTLINTCGTDDVAVAYAATYPVALVSIVLISQIMILFL